MVLFGFLVNHPTVLAIKPNIEGASTLVLVEIARRMRFLGKDPRVYAITFFCVTDVQISTRAVPKFTSFPMVLGIPSGAFLKLVRKKCGNKSVSYDIKKPLNKELSVHEWFTSTKSE